MPGITIIAGQARGRKLKLPRILLGIRPILARIKKSIFDILRNKIQESVFLDLFAGTGSVGIEAISRGAKRVVFVESQNKCISIIKDNLEIFKFDRLSRVINNDVHRYVENSSEQFDIIFMGPPYKDENGMLFLSMPVIKAVADRKLLKPDGWIIVQHHKRELLETYKDLISFREEKYGDSIVSFYKHQRSS
ncbi:MAG: 16S rRNA (guanine(966)-N(2))-methyltransferase RsmD [bacterium]